MQMELGGNLHRCICNACDVPSATGDIEIMDTRVLMSESERVRKERRKRHDQFALRNSKKQR